MHPLINGHATQFLAQLTAAAIPEGDCLDSTERLKEWIEKTRIEFSHQAPIFGYSAGTLDSAKPEDRSFPRFLFDEQDRYLGLAVWMPSLQAWTIPGQIGQLMTLYRAKSTVAADIEARPLAGWYLCDGATTNVPNLTETPFFQGDSPNFDAYTMMYVGA